ncbi:hypothetical protein [Ensifer canadensis]
MTRPVSYACDPANAYCECGACELPPARNIALDDLVSLNRPTFALSTLLILIAGILAIYAIGAWQTERIHTDIIKGRTV